MTKFIASAVILLPLGITLVAPFFIWLLRKNINLREAVSLVAASATFLSVLSLVPKVLAGHIYLFQLFELLPGITVKFCVDGLSLIFAVVASFLWIFATSYNIGYMRSLKEHAQTRYYFCFAVAIFGAIGVAFSANIFTLYLFYEIITVFTYPLVAHHQDEDAYIGARKYIVYLMGTSKLFLLPAMIMTYVLAGTLDFHLGDMVQGIFPPSADPFWVTITYILFIAGLAKAAIMPLHNWLPSAMVAPTPVSALLHAVAVVKAGVFSISRVILSGFGIQTMDALNLGIPTAYLAAFTIVIASVIALTKDDLKARLAYSTVSQLSYIIIGVAMLTPMAITGGLAHIAHHAFSKITLFFAAGAIYVATHLKKISLMSGLGRKMPWTFGAFAIASLSMIGVPPVCGFVSKWYLINGAVDINRVILLAALLLSTALNAGYFGPIVYKAFFEQPKPEVNIAEIKEAPLTMVIPLTLTAIISVLLGLYPEPFLQFIRIFGGG
ncbi:monovalent cation/H+ antiporter subunit D family protein [Desulfohalobiaceae bacterium Ax17]|jgi:multicomponent Na+:H+ antiporter subunit D|uniref:monovalent cation/H+ antiporter subunit D family protein n=1 Tax=Desulfovulcanus ferrireducens TaxID=2831190 RepID=UPI00207BCE1D|nr:monovalent cation/H+ antiporter subunit D family protein [Desulfovulcanus ferrireducens]MBT8763674.1 monovalent cation/H+ antiporter subunit D family protein [Desulfovulcanus ferrireducens]